MIMKNEARDALQKVVDALNDLKHAGWNVMVDGQPLRVGSVDLHVSVQLDYRLEKPMSLDVVNDVHASIEEPEAPADDEDRVAGLSEEIEELLTQDVDDADIEAAGSELDPQIADLSLAERLRIGRAWLDAKLFDQLENEARDVASMPSSLN
jgi:hypothetical protein